MATVRSAEKGNEGAAPCFETDDGFSIVRRLFLESKLE